MKTITFYSYKGGVGRSLALANIATRLSEFGKQVCLLDFDLEAPGLHYKFSTPLNKNEIEIKDGIVDYLYEFVHEGRLNNSIRNFAYPFFILPVAYSTTTLIPAGNTNSPDYWKKLSAINWRDLLYENASGLSFLLNLKEKIKNEIAPEYLLIDSRTGISEMSGITLSLLADEVVVIAANNRENLEGAKKIVKSIADPKNNILGKVPDITFVLSRIPFTENPEDKAREQSLIAKLQRELSPYVSDINVIHSDRDLEENEEIKIGYDVDGVAPQVSRDYVKLFEKLTEGDFTPDQINRFKNIKDAERQYQKAVSENMLPKKLEHIEKAIELNPDNKEFYLFRAAIHQQLGNYQQVIENCDRATYLDTGDTKPYEMKGKALVYLKNYTEAKQAFETILSFNKKHLGAKLGLGEVYLWERNYGSALAIYNDVIGADAENAEALSGRANVKILLGDYSDAMQDVYLALSFNAEHVPSFAALAEVNWHQNNFNEFYLNLERALKLNKKWVESFLIDRRLLDTLKKEHRFDKLAEKYNLQLDDLD